MTESYRKPGWAEKPMQEAMRHCLRIDPKFPSGLARREKNVWVQAGTLTKRGYWTISFNGKRYQAHRVVFYLHTGIDPGYAVVDHIDRNKANNAPENLRIASCAQNIVNNSLSCRNTSGYKGVSWNTCMNKWMACIKLNRKNKNLGYYSDPADAAAAYDKAALATRGQFAFTNSNLIFDK